MTQLLLNFLDNSRSILSGIACVLVEQECTGEERKERAVGEEGEEKESEPREEKKKRRKKREEKKRS